MAYKKLLSLLRTKCCILLTCLLFTSCNLALKTSDKGFYWQKQRVNVDEKRGSKTINRIETISYKQPSSLPGVGNQPGMARLVDSSDLKPLIPKRVLTFESARNGKENKRPGPEQKGYKRPISLYSKAQDHEAQARVNNVVGLVDLFWDIPLIIFLIFAIILIGISLTSTYKNGFTNSNKLFLLVSLLFIIVAGLLFNL